MALMATVRLVSFLVLRAGVGLPSLPRRVEAPLLILLGGDASSATTGAGVPGSGTFQQISGDIQWWAVALSVVGLVIRASGFGRSAPLQRPSTSAGRAPSSCPDLQRC